MTIPYQMGIKLGVVTIIAITTMLTPAPRHSVVQEFKLSVE